MHVRQPHEPHDLRATSGAYGARRHGLELDGRRRDRRRRRRRCHRRSRALSRRVLPLPPPPAHPRAASGRARRRVLHAQARPVPVRRGAVRPAHTNRGRAVLARRDLAAGGADRDVVQAAAIHGRTYAAGARLDRVVDGVREHDAGVEP